jgi:uncharacterized Rossmann fold enzyme
MPTTTPTPTKAAHLLGAQESMTIAQLNERRSKLMLDAAAILQSETTITPEQRSNVDQMFLDADAIEKQVADLKRIEKFNEEQRAFVPATRPTGAEAHQRTDEEKRAHATAALRSYMRNGFIADEYRDVLKADKRTLLILVFELNEGD